MILVQRFIKNQSADQSTGFQSGENLNVGILDYNAL
jgi:hypothetical protein